VTLLRLTVQFGSRALGVNSRLCSKMASGTDKTIYQFTVKDIDGNDVSLEKYRGKAALIVNVASQ